MEQILCEGWRRDLGGKVSYKKRLLWGEGVLLAAVMTLICISSFAVLMKSACDRQEAGERASFQLVEEQFGQFLDTYEGYLHQIAENEVIHEKMEASFLQSDYQMIYKNNQILDHEINSMLGDISHLSGFVLLGKNGYCYEYSTVAQGAMLNSDSGFNEIMRKLDVYNKGRNNYSPFIYFDGSFPIQETPFKSMKGKLKDGQLCYMNLLEEPDGTAYALLLLVIDDKIFDDVFETVGAEKNIILMNRDGRLCWSSREEIQEGPLTDEISRSENLGMSLEKVGKSLFLVTGDYILSENFIVRSLIPVTEFILKWHMLFVSFAVITILSLAVLFLTAPRYLESHLLPLEELIRNMEQDISEGAGGGSKIRYYHRKQRTLRSRIVQFFCLFTIIPSLFYLMAFMVIAYQGLFRQAAEIDALSMRQISANIEQKLKQYDEISKNISYSTQIQKLFSGNVISEQDEKLLSNVYGENKIFRQDVVNLALYSKEGERLYTDNSYFSSQSNFFGEMWRTSTGRAEYLPFLQDSPEQEYMWIGRKVYGNLSLDNHKEVGYTAMLVDLRSIFHTLENRWLNTTGYYFLMTDFGMLLPAGGYTGLVTKNQELFDHCMAAGGDYWELELEQEKYILLSGQIAGARMKVAGIAPVSMITEQIYPVLWVMIAVLGCFILAVIPASALFAGAILRPMENLCDSLEASVTRNQPVRKTNTGIEEVDFLSEHFGAMLNQTKMLTEENYKSRIKQNELIILEREAQLNALQQQINPHFLYNTLESIKWTAYAAGIDEIVDMSTCIGRLLRWGMQKSPGVIPLESELQYLQNYVHIQKLRYGDRFEFDLKVEDSARDCCVIKLMLQPVVENAIIHGIEDVESGGLISVRCFSNNDALCCEVKDNGMGMQEGPLNSLVENMRRSWKAGEGNHIGLSNVYNRLHLLFEDNFLMEIKSIYGKGTKVTIAIPRITESEADRYN